MEHWLLMFRFAGKCEHPAERWNELMSFPARKPCRDAGGEGSGSAHEGATIAGVRQKTSEGHRSITIPSNSLGIGTVGT